MMHFYEAQPLPVKLERMHQDSKIVSYRINERTNWMDVTNNTQFVNITGESGE